ncbi:OPT superfamily oligopeptide transporter [Coemansia reversa NRRL 1564]|uniref:OPT superfamily oligopeptide transporter n=1 Tax=Coemansia reversa (strain ATCC 12441 / NRRL 1564) TaxID=763665 RepID=A0A2G5BF50_COERN|nr:OPT superfamily oligopeptide transporter [Coemansia reversa NRRL 1564]|eukprot:PIA17633.1 OPT superfamily oligopeptide transporter [Coemansia reversa NRRL 1564]
MVDQTQPHFTWRAVLVGLLFGTVLCFSNLWFGLQSGWISMMSLQASLVGFAVFKALERVLDVQFGPAENVVLQSTAVATATMPLAGGFVGILPALKMLDADEANGARTVLGYGQLCAWGLALTFFGVFFAVPLRKQTIVREKLRFPSGTATAQMISVLHKRPDPTLEEEDYGRSSARLAAGQDAPSIVSADDGTGMRRRDNSSPPQGDTAAAAHKLPDDVQWITKLAVLGVSFVLSGGYALLAHFFPAITALPVFGGYLANEWEWNLMPSLSYAGQGIIMGLPTCLWMLVGSVVGWGILSPVARNEGWAPGPVSDWKTGSRGWILWISLAVMIAESLVSLAIIAGKELFNAYSLQMNSADVDVTKPNSQDSMEDEVDSRFLVPGWITWGGLLVSTMLCMGIVKALFDVPLYDTLIAVVLALPLAVLGVRALGETDLNPVSGIGKISQVIFAGVMPGNMVGNLIAGGIAEAGAQQAGDLMQDLKTGHLLNASPRAQFAGQIIGSVFSVFVTAGAYLLYTNVYPIPSRQFPVPTAQVWLDMARLVNGQPLPSHVWPFITVFALVFVALPIFGTLVVRKATLQRWWPSGIAFAMGIYNTPNFTLMRAIGAITTAIVTEVVVMRSKRQSAAINSTSPLMHESLLRRKLGMLAIIMASGFVLGEGTLSFFILLSQAF